MAPLRKAEEEEDPHSECFYQSVAAATLSFGTLAVACIAFTAYSVGVSTFGGPSQCSSLWHGGEWSQGQKCVDTYGVVRRMMRTGNDLAFAADQVSSSVLVLQDSRNSGIAKNVHDGFIRVHRLSLSTAPHTGPRQD